MFPQQITFHSQALGGVDLRGIFTLGPSEHYALLLFHNASGTMDNPILKITEEEALKKGISVLRFNYHYVDGIGPDAAKWEDLVFDTEAAFAKLKELAPGAKYLIGGKSLGTLSVLYLATTYPEEISAIGLYSAPKKMLEKYLGLESLGKLSHFAHIYQGDKDDFATSAEIDDFFNQLGKSYSVVTIANGVHSFEKYLSEDELKHYAKSFVEDLLTY